MAVEILIPYWGDPALMKEAVNSVLAQTSDQWRLTIVDDAYPSLEIRDWIAELDHPRIAYHRKPVNEGLVANFRTTVGMATEPLLVNLGSDDRLLPNYVEEILRVHAQFPQASMIQPGVRVIDEDGNESLPLADRVKQRLVRPRGHGPQVLSGEALVANLLTGNWLYWPSIAFRTDRIQSIDFREEYAIVLDLALIVDLLAQGDVLVTTPKVCFEYRRHSASASSLDLLDGKRFAGDRHYFAAAAAQARALGWRRAEMAARLRLTARAHALTLLPEAVRTRDTRGVRTVLRHAFGA